MPNGLKGFQKGNNFGSNKTSFKKGLIPWNYGKAGKHNPQSNYASTHNWLKFHFSKADRCENIDCPKTSNTFQWALLKCKKYEKKRENFIMLCRVCHCKYDNWIKKMWSTREKNGNHFLKLSIPKIKSIIKLSKNYTQKQIANMFNVNRSIISKIVNKKYGQSYNKLRTPHYR